jgi:hypothetical protein
LHRRDPDNRPSRGAASTRPGNEDAQAKKGAVSRLKVGLILLVVYVVASAILAWVLRPDPTVAKMDGVLLELIPRVSLPLG